MPKQKHVWVVLSTPTDYDGWPRGSTMIEGNVAYADMDVASEIAKDLDRRKREQGTYYSIYAKDLILVE